MARYYHEETSSNSEDWATPPDTVSKSGTLLRREFWRGQLHGGRPGKGPVHARHMRSRCSLVPLGMKFLAALYIPRQTLT